jgi:YD repeat-containing protein
VLLAPSALGGADAGALVELLTPEVELELVRVPDSETLCGAGGVVRFRLAREARVSLSAQGVTGPTPALLPPGVHELALSAVRRQGLAMGERPFALAALPAGAGPPATVSGTLRDERLDRPVMRVGRTFVSGVDLLEGHLVHQATDLKLEGRHLQLEVTRTYSSAGRSSAGMAGAGWRVNQESALTPVPDCGLAVVRTADGGSQTFLGNPGLAPQAFRPERGYHTQLRRNADGSFDFFDKASVRHHFGRRAAGTAATLRLEWIEEPHGDRIALEYDASGRLSRVSEWHPRLGPVRTLVFRHARVGAGERLASVEAWGLGLRVDYRHDTHGNLVHAERTDRAAGQSADRYEYADSDARDPHQLTAATRFGEARTTYEYGPASGSPAGRDPVDALDPRELARVVHDASAAGPYTFRYDRSRAGEGVFRVEVDAGKEGVTRYVLNADGNPLEIDAPAAAGREVTKLSWDPVHVVKTAEHSSSGRRVRYAYDAAGNLTLDEDQERPGAPTLRTVYAYDPRFNKLVHKQDKTGRSSWTLDPQTGDLLRAALADGTLTTWAYDKSGCLSEAREAGGRTRYLRPDTFCYATEVHTPDGSVNRRRYDPRGRLLDETKSKAP